MHYIGLDLAWGPRNPTGVAVLAADGTLLLVASAVTDDEIMTLLQPYVLGPVVVAIDAPLIVNNERGQRPAETALNKDFSALEAGAHPSNTNKPEFAQGARGMRLAKRLGLDVTPLSREPRRGMEVYPHPATISLFRLPKTLKYKHKTGRSLESLRAAQQQLMQLMESLAEYEPSMHLGEVPLWVALCGQVKAAKKKAQLKHVEDQVDAVLCAYLSMFVDQRPGDVTVYGDAVNGAIITPRLGVSKDRPVVSPRLAPTLVHTAVQQYAQRYPELIGITEAYRAAVTRLLDDAGINYLSVTARTKSVASFAGKANRQASEGPAYSDPLRQITDQIGLRVVTYVQSDVAAVADLLADQLLVHDDRDMGQETAREGRFGYNSRHLLVQVSADHEINDLRSHTASVQLRTVLQHAWAEFEHDIRYKGTIPEQDAPDLDRRFTLAAGLLELADAEFSEIRKRLQSRAGQPVGDTDTSDPRISAQDLAAFLSAGFPDAGWSRTEHYAWVSGLLLELGITSLTELRDLIYSVDSTAISQRLGYRYPPGAVRRLDDALLAIFGPRYIQLHGNQERVALLGSRWKRLQTPAV